MRKFNSWNNNGNSRPPNRRPAFRPLGKFDLRVDVSREILSSFTFRMVKAEPGEDNERLLRRFKRIVESTGILSELKKREYYKSPSEDRRERHMKAIKNSRKRQAKLERYADYDSKKVNTRPPPQQQYRRPSYNQAPVQDNS
jgi:small subunit ribosomal protein S21